MCVFKEREKLSEYVTHNLVSYLSIPHPFHFSPVLYCIEGNKILQFVFLGQNCATKKQVILLGNIKEKFQKEFKTIYLTI